jgi:hypothetical protein
MSKAKLIIAGIAVLLLSACSKHVVGTYACSGIPDINTLILESDGGYASKGNIMGHATAGLGRYKSDAHQVMLEGSYTVEGLTVTEPDKVIFDRQSNGDLKSLLTLCKKQ